MRFFFVMIIRKISVGSDYKSSMHYLVGQQVLGGKYVIHLISYEEDKERYQIFVNNDTEIYLWKEYNKNIPISVEFNMNF